MAGRDDLEELVFQLSADVSKLTKANRDAVDIIKKMGKNGQDEADRAGKEVFSKFFGHGKSEGEKAVELSRSQMMELAHVTRSVFDGLAAGANPMRLAAMEGGRLVQALTSGPGGLGGALGAIAGMFNPVVAGVVGLVAALGAGVLAEQDYEKSHLRLLQLFNGLARGARVSIGEVEALALANAKAGYATVGASEQFIQAFISINGMTRENLGQAISIVNDFAKATGQDAKGALGELAKAFQNPHDGVVDLNREVSAFTQEQIRSIQAMADAGDKAGALAAIQDGLKSAVHGSAEELTTLGKALKAVSEGFSAAWREAGEFFAHMVRAPTLDEMKAKLEGMRTDGVQGAAHDDVMRKLEAKITALEQRQGAGSLVSQVRQTFGIRSPEQIKSDQEFNDETGITTGLARQRNTLNAQLGRLRDALAPGGDRHGASDQEINERILQIKRQLQRLDRREGIKPVKETDTTLSNDKAATDALDQATTERIQAEAKLSEDLRERARIEKEAINAATDKQRDDLDARRREIDASKGNKNKGRQLAALDAADAELDRAQTAKERAIDEKLALDLQKASLELDKQQLDARRSVLSEELGMAKTRADRRSIQLQLLDLEQQEVNAKLAEARSKAHRDDPSNGAAIDAGFGVMQSMSDNLFNLRRQDATDKNLSPFAEWAKSAQQSSQEVNEAVQSYAVKSMDQFNAGIAGAIANGKNLGQVMAGVFKSMETDLIQYLLKQAEIGIVGSASNASGASFIGSVLAALPHFAGGTSSAPGGLSLVGERGPELVNLPRGAQVLSNSALRGLGGSSGARAAQSGAMVVNTTTFQLSSPVVTADLLAQMQAISKQSETRAVQASLAAGRRALPGQIRSNQLLAG